MERISLLQGGLALIQPGGRTEIEANEQRDRIEDAVCAVKAAIQQGGFVAGGGAALLHSIPRLSDLLEQEGSIKSESWRFGV